jgi:N-acetylglucosamine-6-phosphate deacetylase
MVVLSGAAVVLRDRVQEPGTLVIDSGRIVDVTAGATPKPAGATADEHLDLHGHCIVPGFIDVHVHGLEGVDSLDGADAIGQMAARLPKYGVTAFCPTTVACSPVALRQVLTSVRHFRSPSGTTARPGARVLGAHLESNFINPAYGGAQPSECLRVPRVAATPDRAAGDGFESADILAEIERAGDDVGIVTLAPELDGGYGLIGQLVARGTRVSLGHSAATFEQALEAISLGARQATHLFNRMPPMRHRDPGLAGAVLASESVAAELICDGVHVHAAMLRIAIAAKRPARVMAITDGTAGAGLPVGSRARLGGRPISVRDAAAYLDDDTLAGSVATMDRVFRLLVRDVGLSLVDAARLCSTTPAAELGLEGAGTISPGAAADLTVLDHALAVTHTFVGGRRVHGPSE